MKPALQAFFLLDVALRVHGFLNQLSKIMKSHIIQGIEVGSFSRFESNVSDLQTQLQNKRKKKQRQTKTNKKKKTKTKNKTKQNKNKNKNKKTNPNFTSNLNPSNVCRPTLGATCRCTNGRPEGGRGLF